MAMNSKVLVVLLIASMSIGSANNVYSKNRTPQQKSTDGSIAFLKSFFEWYKTKYDYLDHHIFPVAMDLKKNTPYRIDFKATEKYLAILKSSGFFSDGYIQSQRDYFKKIDITLKKAKQNDGPVDGLDGDSIVWSQEPGSILENLNNIKLMVASSKSNEITVEMHTPFDVDRYLAYDLKKVNGKFLIDKISNITKKVTPAVKR